MKWYLNFGVIILFMGLLFFGVLQFIPRTTLNTPTLKTNILSVDDGYGYQIFKDGKLVIQQEYIPAISGQYSFRKLEDAQTVANLVRNKLMNGHEPMVTVKELAELNIVILTDK
tara:strand:+ start:4702 stop:5043 length:342 start_codon:yes stop_codon:yes gene_type:complete